MIFELINSRGQDLNPRILMPPNLTLGSKSIILEFDDISATVPTGGTVEVDNVNFIHGNGSMKLTTNAGANVDALKTVTYSLAAFNAFRFSVYVPDATYANHIYVRCYQGASFFRATIDPYKNGWNYFVVLRSQFSTSGTPSWTADFDKIKISTAQTGSGVFTASIDFIEGFTTAPIPAVFISYDGQYENVYDNAFPIMKRYNIPATMYTQTGTIGGTGIMSHAQLADLQKHGWCIASHSDTHVNLTTLSAEEQEAEIIVARDKLLGFGYNGAYHIGFPYGAYNADTFIAMANSGTITGRVAGGGSSSYFDFRKLWSDNLGGTVSLATAKAFIDLAIANNAICSIYLHKIVTGTPVDTIEWEQSKYIALMEYIVETGIQPVTISELYSLMEESKTTTVSKLIRY